MTSMIDMSASHTFHRRQLLSVARKYRRDGYSVIFPDRTTEMPSFLGDHIPDLIATSDNDRVVIEIKQAASLRGSNDLVDLARRVEQNPTWRFELIALASQDGIGSMSQHAVDESRREVVALMDARFYGAAFLYAFTTTERLISSIAARNRINTSNDISAQLARKLVTRGSISADHYDAITTALSARNRIVDASPSARAGRSEVEDLLKLNDTLLEEMQVGVAA